MSGFEYGALGIVSIISPSSELRIMHNFFCWFLILQEILCQNLTIFINRLTIF